MRLKKILKKSMVLIINLMSNKFGYIKIISYISRVIDLLTLKLKQNGRLQNFNQQWFF